MTLCVPGDTFVSRTDGWTDLRSMFVVAEAGEGKMSVLVYRNSVEEPEYFTIDAELDEGGWLRVPGEDSEHRTLMQQVGETAARIVLEGGADFELSALLSELEGSLRWIEPATLHDLVRCYVGSGELKVTVKGVRPPKTLVSLARVAKDEERKRSYASSFAHELAIQSRRVGELIGHAQTAGNFREALLRSLLQKHVPERYHVATGFIAGEPKQQDVIVYDRLEHAPLFREGDLVVVPWEAVRALIEVKTTLDSEELEESLDTFNHGTPTGHPDLPPIFKGVFAFGIDKHLNVARTIRNYHKEPDPREEAIPAKKWNTIDCVGRTATAVCVLGRSLHAVSFRSRTIGDTTFMAPAIIELFSVAGRSSQAAVFFEMLLRFLRHPAGGPHRGGWVGDLLRQDTLYRNFDWLHEGLFGPHLFGASDRAAILDDRTTAYSAWIEGHEWRPGGLRDVPKPG